MQRSSLGRLKIKEPRREMTCVKKNRKAIVALLSVRNGSIVFCYFAIRFCGLLSEASGAYSESKFASTGSETRWHRPYPETTDF